MIQVFFSIQTNYPRQLTTYDEQLTLTRRVATERIAKHDHFRYS